MVTVSDVVAPMERYAPAWLAESWDHVGLQLGDNRQEVHRMMVTLDVRPETVAEAVDAGVDLIYAHHPAMFHAVKTRCTRPSCSTGLPCTPPIQTWIVRPTG